MRTTFVFDDGTSWEWKDDPTEPEDVEIKFKYFGNQFPDPFIVHPKVIQIINTGE